MLAAVGAAPFRVIELIILLTIRNRSGDTVRRAAILLGSLTWCFPAAAQSVDWSGAYIGGFVGAAWTDRTIATDLTGEWNNPLNPLNQMDRAALLPVINGGKTITGAIGGAAAGYNWLVDQLLLGVEADYSAVGGTDSATRTVTAINPYRVETSSDVDWVATFRGRLGFTYERSLVYVTGGLAVGEPRFTQSIAQLNFPYVETAALSSTKAGWVLGAGLEHALDSEWSLRLQYLHVDLGSQSRATSGVCPPPNVAVCEVYTSSRKVDFALDSATAGIVYRFSGP